MDESWQQIAGSLTRTVQRTEGVKNVRKYPSWQLSNGEIVTTLGAARDKRNTHGLSQKQLYRRLKAAEEQHRKLSPEDLWKST